MRINDNIVYVYGAGQFAQDQSSVLLSGPAVLQLQNRRHNVQLDGRHFRHVPVAAGHGPSAVLPLAVQPERVLRADGRAAERDAARGRPHRAFRAAQRLAVRAPRLVPGDRHGHGRQRRHVLQPGDQGRGGLLELQPGLRARHAGRAVLLLLLRGAQLSQRPQGGQGVPRAAGVDAQQRVAQVPVRQSGSQPGQLQNNHGVHGRRGQGHGVRMTASGRVQRCIARI